MPSGTLEVLLASANGIKSRGDFFSKTDAYAILCCGSQCQKSIVPEVDQGRCPTWNQSFLFSVEEGVEEVTLKIMDEDFMTADDELGCVTYALSLLLRPFSFGTGKTATRGYNVVKKSGKNKGEVKLSLTFTPKQRADSFNYNVAGNSTHGPSLLAQDQAEYQEEEQEEEEEDQEDREKDNNDDDKDDDDDDEGPRGGPRVEALIQKPPRNKERWTRKTGREEPPRETI
ncbi:hypothetical protein L7F22_034270 [Adiantum nelumboides]|nr:hypothetical protein [Adiantum nelumboides]